MELILVRHGETDGNLKRQYIGRTDVPLNETGKSQAERVRGQVAEYPVKRVLHSPYQRTLETAEIVMQGRTAEWLADERLAELDFGAWEALTYSEVEMLDRDRLWAWYDDPYGVTPPRGESLDDLDQRVGAWLAEVTERAEQGADGALLVVAHGGTLRWLLAKYVLQEEWKFHSLRLEPGGLVVLAYQRGERGFSGKWTLVRGEIEA